MGTRLAALAAAAALLAGTGVWAQHSRPVAENAHIARNKFKLRDVSGVEDIVFGTDASRFDPHTACPQRVHQSWATEVEASCYVTPAIFDVASDGVKDVVIPTFIRHVEVLDGTHGQHVAGFPFTFPNSAFYASPIIFDINLDGEPDIGVTSFDGELVWLSENGMPIFGKSIKIPHLRIKKDWYKGLKDDPQDMAHTGLTQHEREELESQPKEEPDPLASGKLASTSSNTYWDVRDSGWGDYGPHQLAENWLVAADSDGDKKLTKEEFVTHLLEEDPALTSDEVDIMFSSFDEDNDKKVDIKEMTLHMDELAGNQAEADFFARDLNGDNSLDVDEFVKMYREAKSLLAEEKIRARFGDVDTDHDGIIELKEAKYHWDAFQPADGEKAKRPRKKRGLNRHKVTERAKDQLQVSVHGETLHAPLLTVSIPLSA